nr:uncharacterized mitochondrial protein AtMg00810-like [Tanacetum cinerariifolium]
GELTFFLGLQVKQKDDGIFISQDKYVAKILRKFGLTDGKTASTPIDTKKPLLKDPGGKDVDIHIYRSMIGSLMYLTSSRSDIMFAVCACSRFQVTLRVSHLHVVKRIFRYLKGKPHLGLWYLKDSPFNLVAYSDSDYAGASLDRKSTTGGCQFLGYRLISWQCQKQTVVATSSTEAEYVYYVDEKDGIRVTAGDLKLLLTRQSCSSIRDYQAQAEGKEIRKEEEIKAFWFKEGGGRIEAIYADEDVTLVDMETKFDLDAEHQGRIERKDDDNVTAKEVNAVKPTVFDDEEVTMTMAQTLIKMKHEKARILDKQMAKRLHDEEVKQAAAREKPIFEREYNKVQTFLKPDKDEEPIKKRVAEEILLYESFKKLRAEVKVSGSHSTQNSPTDDPKKMFKEDVKNMLQIVPVSEFKVEALQVKYHLIDWEIQFEGSRSYWKIIRVGGITQAYQSFEDMLKDFNKEDLDALWRLAKEKFNTAMPTEDKEKALWVELKRLYEPNAADVFWKLQRYMHDPLTWKLYTNCGVYQVSSTRRHDIFMFTEKDYPLIDVMDAPTIPVSAVENLGDPINIRVDIIHQEPVTTVDFPVAAIEEMSALRFRIGMDEAENASLRGKIKTLKAIETVTRS